MKWSSLLHCSFCSGLLWLSVWFLMIFFGGDCLFDWLIFNFAVPYSLFGFFYNTTSAYNTYNSGNISEEWAERLWEPKFQLTSHRPKMGWLCYRYLRFSWKYCSLDLEEQRDNTNTFLKNIDCFTNIRASKIQISLAEAGIRFRNNSKNEDCLLFGEVCDFEMDISMLLSQLSSW